jgi:YVTN family beta-propeller protein
MKKFLLFILSSICLVSFGQQNAKAPINSSYTLPNGWSLTPVGRSLELGDFPLNIAVSSSKKLLAVSNNGQGIQSIQLIDQKSSSILDKTVIAKAFYGLKFSKDEKYLYASGGNDNQILQYEIQNNKLILKDSLILGKPWPNKISPVGLEIDEKRNLIYTVTKENNSLYIVDITKIKPTVSLNLGHEGYTCILSPDSKILYISLWGGKKIALFDTELQKIISEIPVSFNPNELIFTKDGSTLYVANAGDNSVSVINTKERKVVEVLDAAIYPNSLVGSVTNGLALSEDEKTLFIANADNNCIAVFDVNNKGESISKGFIPVGWYPTSVRVVGKKLFVANGKGFTSFANPKGPQPVSTSIKSESHSGEDTRGQYIGNLMKGTLSIVDFPDETLLKKYTQMVYTNTPYNKNKELIAAGENNNPIPFKVGDPSPIKHVFYILKENRTYDQVLGDVKEGNGDTSLCLFGNKYTPNQHKMAKDFVLLDNFYVDAEVSADGHNWSLGAHANDYLEKTWPTGYGRRGGVTEGMGRRQIANDKDGFIWDFCKRANISFRTYGVFADDNKGNIPVLDASHVCSSFTGYYNQKVKDTARFTQWKNDFDSLVAKNSVPAFNSIRLGADHTQGTAVGKPTPFACVADNDLAVGMFLEHLSNSPIWEKSAVFIIEDDAQNGPDHVDAHRSTAYLAGPFVKRNYVDHTMYTTSGMLRTMELILGLKPMSQYDAAATPMFKSFTNKPNFSKFKSLPSNVDLDELNTARTPSAIKSENLVFTEVDSNDDNLFNEILWKGIKGEDAILPAPRRVGFVFNAGNKKD